MSQPSSCRTARPRRAPPRRRLRRRRMSTASSPCRAGTVTRSHAVPDDTRDRCSGWSPSRPPSRSRCPVHRVQRATHVNGYGETPPQRMAVHGRSRMRYPVCSQTPRGGADTAGTFLPAGHRAPYRTTRSTRPADSGMVRRFAREGPAMASSTVTSSQSPGHHGRISPSGGCADSARRPSSPRRCGGPRARSASGSAATRATSGGSRRARSAAPTTRTSGCSCTCSPAAR